MQFVVGHVGRLSYQKNHELLIRIFSELHKKDANTILLLIGVGEKEDEIREQVHELNLDESVRFLGNRDDVNELYQAMDVFVMPSLFEGIPVVGVEAQFSGLPCVFSDKVPVEVKFTENSEFVSLEKKPEDWADVVLDKKVNSDRIRDLNFISKSIYNIKNSCNILDEYYMRLQIKNNQSV